MGRQLLDKHTGQPEFLPGNPCPHGVWQDERGNSGCEECLEDRLTEQFKSAMKAGAEQEAKSTIEWLRAKAGSEFADGNDDTAKLIRSLARELQEELDGP